MKYILYFSILLGLMTSCSKSNPSPNNPVVPPTPTPDTLSSGWSNVISGVDSTVNDIFFTDTQNGFACGKDGIIKSTNGGLSWTKISNQILYFNISALNANKAIFVRGNSGATLYNNGNLSDIALPLYIPPLNFSYGDAAFTDNNTCYLSTIRYIWKSVDGGNHFDSIFNFNAQTSSSVNTLCFINNSTGWIIRNDSLYKTTNGGLNWSFIYHQGITGNTEHSIDFLDNNIGFISIGKEILKTIDGGLHFTSIFRFNTNNLVDLDFVTPSIGFISGDNRIYKTSDGGQTWSPIVQLGNTHNFFEIHFIDENHGWACGSNGLILRYAQ